MTNNFFSYPHELTKIVLQNFKVSNWTISTRELNYIGCSFFSVTYITGRDQRVPVSVFFGSMKLFEKFFNVSKVSPFMFFFEILQQNGCQKIRKGPPFSAPIRSKKILQSFKSQIKVSEYRLQRNDGFQQQTC